MGNIVNAIKQYYVDPRKYIGLIHFGSTISSPGKHNDIDIVLFPKRSRKYKHVLEMHDGFQFDVFEMPIEYAFYLLRAREDLWVHGFATGNILFGEDKLQLLKTTADKILKSKTPKISEQHCNRLAYSLTYSHAKYKENHESPVLSKIYFSYFIQDIFDTLIKLNPNLNGTLFIGGRKEKINKILTEFGDISVTLNSVLNAEGSSERLLLTNKLVDQIVRKYDLKVSYPIYIQDYTDVSKYIKSMK